MRYFSKEKARKYLLRQNLHVEMTKDLWKTILNNGRLIPDKGRKFSKARLDQYVYEIKPR